MGALVSSESPMAAWCPWLAGMRGLELSGILASTISLCLGSPGLPVSLIGTHSHKEPSPAEASTQIPLKQLKTDGNVGMSTTDVFQDNSQDFRT